MEVNLVQITASCKYLDLSVSDIQVSVFSVLVLVDLYGVCDSVNELWFDRLDEVVLEEIQGSVATFESLFEGQAVDEWVCEKGSDWCKIVYL
jgi:hypothetical protein